MSTLEEHLISATQQQQLKDEYLKKNHKFINQNRPLDKPDSLMYTYDLDILFKYLNYVKEESLKQNLKNVRISICMGQYPETGFDNRLNPEYGGYQTVYLTAENETGDSIEGISAMDIGDVNV